MSKQVIGAMKAKARTNKAFKLDDNKWYEVSGKTEEFLANIQKPYPTVEVTYEQEGYKRKVTFIKPVIGGIPTTTETVVDTGSTSKSSYAYTKKPTVNNKTTQEKPSQEYWDKRGNDIKKGNALNAASYAISGTEADTEVLAEKVTYLASKFYEWLTLED